MPLESLIEFVTSLIADHLYVGVFLAALIETIIPPIPTMAVFPTAGYIASQNNLGVPEVVLLGIIGGFGGRDGVGEKIPVELCYEEWSKALLDHYDTDVFLHSWSVEDQEKIINNFKKCFYLLFTSLWTQG